MDSKYFDTIRKVRAILPNNLHMGGSMALKKFFFNTEHIEPNDLDLFYYGPKPFERSVLEQIFGFNFTILKHGYKYDGTYLFGGQYWFLKCLDDNEVTFDIIFIDPRNCYSEMFGHTLAGIQYKVDYSEEMLSKPNLEHLKDYWNLLQETRRVHIYGSGNTEQQLEKVLDRCNKLGLEVKRY